eukprot:6840326-Alexandrium_andersonii.AAC.1
MAPAPEADHRPAVRASEHERGRGVLLHPRPPDGRRAQRPGDRPARCRRGPVQWTRGGGRGGGQAAGTLRG